MKAFSSYLRVEEEKKSVDAFLLEEEDWRRNGGNPWINGGKMVWWRQSDSIVMTAKKNMVLKTGGGKFPGAGGFY